MQKLLLLGGLVCALPFVGGASGMGGNHVPDGTNVWIGAASGGSWSNEANWRAESPSGLSVKELFARHCVYDLRALGNGAVVTNDLVCANVYGERDSKQHTMVAGILCAGAAGDVWTIRQNGGKGLFFCSPCRLEIDDGTLVWEDVASGAYPYKEPNKYGTGEFRFRKMPSMWESVGHVRAGTLGFTNNAGTLTYCWRVYDGARLAVHDGVTKISQIFSKSGDGTTAAIDVAADATLQLNTGFNNYKSGESFYGDLTGAGTLAISGGGVHRFWKGGDRDTLSFTGTIQPYLGELELGTAESPVGLNAAAKVDVAGAGWLRLFGSQTIAALSGIGCEGGVSYPAASVLTVAGTGTPSTNVYAGRVSGGDFVKRGAGDTLVLKGASVNTGTTRVEEGTLALSRGLLRKNLRAYWNFDDPDDMGADMSADGLLPLAVGKNASVRPCLVDDGVSGRAIHFGDGQDMKKGGKFYRANTDALNAVGVLPSVRVAFTISFWMRPTPGKCGSGTNFLKIDNGNFSKDIETEDGVVTREPNWDGSGFFFGSVKLDEDKLDAGNKDAAIPAFQHLGFYCGTGWTRGGAYNDGGTEKPFAKRVAIAKFDSADYLMDGAWHHVVGTYSNRVIRIYVDGVLKDERTRDGDLSLSGNPYVQLCNYADDIGHTYSGDLDEIQWLAEAWSEADVQAEYAARNPAAFRRGLPKPVAHWTFDEPNAANGYADVTGNGFDLVNASTNGTAVVGHEAVSYTGESGLTGGAAKLVGKAAYLKLKDGVDMTSVLPVGSSFTIVLRCGYPGNAPFFMFGDGTAEHSVYLGDCDCPRIQYWLVGDKTSWNARLSLGDCGTYGSWIYFHQSAYCLNTLVYDAPRKTLRLYRDGKLLVMRDKTFSINPTKLQWGYVDGRCFENLRLDDLRIYNEALTSEEVACVARSVRYGGTDAPYADRPILSADSPVTVAAGATLEARGAEVHGVKSLAGAGTVKVVGSAAFHAADYTGFTGSVVGTGRLLVEPGQTVPLTAAQVAADVAFKDDVVTVSAANETTPLVRTAGRVVLPTAGVLKLAGATTANGFFGKTFLLAECSAAVCPPDTSAWTFEPACTDRPSLKFRFANGRLYAKVGGGALLIIR